MLNIYCMLGITCLGINHHSPVTTQRIGHFYKTPFALKFKQLNNLSMEHPGTAELKCNLGSLILTLKCSYCVYYLY